MASRKKRDKIGIVERIVRNLPIHGEPKWRFIDTTYGRIRFAYGTDGTGRYHGAWCIDDDGGEPMVARPIEFGKDNTESLVAKELVTDAWQMLKSLHIRGMLKREWWDARRHA